MDIKNLILPIGLLLLIGYLYDKYNNNLERDKQFEDFEIVRKFLLGESKEVNNLRNSSKPILWIPINYEKNARSWESFFSRSSTKLNLPYYFYTIKSIILRNNNDFNICIIDDSTICKLLDRDEFEYNLDTIAEPRKNIVRLLGLTKLVYKFGGLVVSPSFLSFASFKNINSIIDDDVLLFGENKNSSVSYDKYPYVPSCELFASKKNNEELNNFIEYLDNLVKNDYTAENLFVGNINNYLINQFRNNKIGKINAEYLGIKDKNNNQLYIKDLLGSSFIEFNNNAYGLMIPNNDIMKRTEYNWFCYLSIEEILKSEFILAKLLITNCK